MSERERTLLNALSRAHADIRELQTQVQSLLTLNLRYAEELRHALTADPPRKRPRVDADRTEPDAALTPNTAQMQSAPDSALASSAARAHAATLGLTGPQPLYIGPRLRTPSYPQAIVQSLGVGATQHIYRAMQQTPRFQGMMAADGSSVLSTEASATSIQQLLVPSSTPTLSAGAAAFDKSREHLPVITLADAAASMATMAAPAAITVAAPAAITAAAPISAQANQAEPDALHISEHGSLSAPAVAQGSSLGSLADAASASATRPRALTAERLDVSELELGDPGAIPSIGKFSSPRQLYQFRERVQAYEQQHGAQWRERMDSKRRQNWSRISAVYMRIVQLRGPEPSADELERALRAVDDEMAQSRVTLTKYSQVVRKQLASERRESAQRNQKTARLGSFAH
ncbi:hypothetical protein IWW50_001690 [Coemansia erecta]|nr:hypothetical protein IWW50_001690 [Coemansia erecta]